MMSAYIASLRPIALIIASPGASLFWFSSLIPIGNASNVLAHLWGVCESPRHDSRTIQ
jgi:hypothetical protein